MSVELVHEVEMTRQVGLRLVRRVVSSVFFLNFFLFAVALDEKLADQLNMPHVFLRVVLVLVVDEIVFIPRFVVINVCVMVDGGLKVEKSGGIDALAFARTLCGSWRGHLCVFEESFSASLISTRFMSAYTHHFSIDDRERSVAQFMFCCGYLLIYKAICTSNY